MPRLRNVLSLAVGLAAMAWAIAAQSAAPQIGIAIMHGKGGSPGGYVSDLASSLEEKGYLVANLEMPWSGRRNYDVPVDAAVTELQSALEALRSRGAKKVFVAGHSLGGLFAVYYGGKQPVDGVIAIAPGGSVSTPVFRAKLADSVAHARRLVAAGTPNETTRFMDYESSRGTFPVITTPGAYLSWFDPDGAMSMLRSAKAMNPKVPVLYVAPTDDYPGLVKTKHVIFSALPSHPLTRLYEPDATHANAPSASRGEILRWTAQVASGS